MKVVLVDDDPVVCALLQDFFSAYGLELKVFNSPSQAISHIPTEEPDVLILDYVMPEMSGAELLNRLRTEAKTHCPVIMLSATDEDSDECNLGEGVKPDCFLQKPLNIKELINTVKNIANSK